MNKPPVDDEVLQFLQKSQQEEHAQPPVRDERHFRGPSTAARYRRRVTQARLAAITAIVAISLYVGMRIGWRLLVRWADGARPAPAVLDPEAEAELEEAYNRMKLENAIGASRAVDADDSAPAADDGDDFGSGDKFERALRSGGEPQEPNNEN